MVLSVAAVIPGLMRTLARLIGLTQNSSGTTSVLFGLWHVVPLGHIGASNEAVAASGASEAAVLAGTVALTSVGGLVFGELRRRSGSVVASAGAHWATNALGVLVGVVARLLAR